MKLESQPKLCEAAQACNRYCGSSLQYDPRSFVNARKSWIFTYCEQEKPRSLDSSSRKKGQHPKDQRTALPDASSVLCMATTQSSAEASEAPLGDAWGAPRAASARLGEDARSTGSQASRATSDTGTYATIANVLRCTCRGSLSEATVSNSALHRPSAHRFRLRWQVATAALTV